MNGPVIINEGDARSDGFVRRDFAHRHDDGLPDAGRVDVLGVGINAMDLESAAATIGEWIRERRHNYVCVADAHCVIEARNDERLRNIYKHAGMTTADGMPLVWLSRLLGERRLNRVRGSDLVRTLSAISAKQGYRQFYYGGAEGVAEKLRDAMVGAYPGLEVAGVLSPPFRTLTPEEDQSLVDRINAAGPDVLLVGLGAPKQEIWMANHVGRIEAPVMIGVGAAFDFLTGIKPQAPLWMQQAGLEWFFRVCSEPRRLGRRYAHVVPAFTLLAARALAFRALHPQV